MLSFKEEGKPLAIIRGGKKDHKVIRIVDELERNDKLNLENLPLSKFNQNELSLLKDAIDNDNEQFLFGKLKRTFNKIKNNGHLGKHYKIDDGILKLIPTNDPNQRDSIYCCGPSGSGKTTMISQFVEEYRKVYPKNPLIVISNKPKDYILDKFIPIRIRIDENLINDPVSLDELEDSLVIFDDIDQIQDKNIQNAVWNLRDRILEEGRSKQISICTVAHQITNYKASRICLNESDYIILFCKSGQRYQINYFLKVYAGLDKHQIKQIMDLPSRCVILKRTYPMAVIYSNGVFLL